MIEQSANKKIDGLASSLFDLIDRIKGLEKKVAELERQLADRPSVEELLKAIIESLRKSGVRI